MMKKLLYYTTVLSLFGCLSVQAQRDSITRLDEVLLSDVRVKNNSLGQEVLQIPDSTLQQHQPLLTDVLKYNTPIYFRENGYGGVSSASFRGTTASQTAVVWNGINVNSQLNGQTDFNTINTTSANSVSVRSGGGSVLYGSGAIGGSVHLNTAFSFTKEFSNRLQVNYGSFDTFSGNYTLEASDETTSVQFRLGRVQSENDFPYLDTSRKNRNGDFYNTSVNGAVAHFLNKNHLVKFYSTYFEGERGFSGTLTAPSKSMYEDQNARNLLEWKAFYGKMTTTLQFAYLEETYRFFENRNSELYTYGNAKTHIAKYNLRYGLGRNLSLNGIVEWQHILGSGSDIGKEKRNIGAASLLLRHTLKRVAYEISVRQELADTYTSPFLFSASTAYRVAPFYRVKANVSKNFRIPTLNDLYWYGSGNVNLQPETSYQAEIGHELTLKNWTIHLTAFYMDIDNLLRWVPDSGGLWRPENTQHVTNHGLESTLTWKKKMGNHRINVQGTYGFTKTKDHKTGKALIYVPEHKATLAMGYRFRRLAVQAQLLLQDAIFTSADNHYMLDGYTLSNLNTRFALGEKQSYSIGIRLENIFNTAYQSLPSRPMPGRSIHSSLTLKF